MKKMRRVLALLAIFAPTLVAGIGIQAAHASASCWSSVGTPYFNGSQVSTTVTWQCSGGVQSIENYATLDAPNGTRYSDHRTCPYPSSCSVTITAPMTEGTWTARAQYAYVVENSYSAGQYFFGGANSATVVYPTPVCNSYAGDPYRSGNTVYSTVQISCNMTVATITISPSMSSTDGFASSFSDTCYGVPVCSRTISHYYVPGTWTAYVNGSGTLNGKTGTAPQGRSNAVYL